jgi:hypothetical protein
MTATAIMFAGSGFAVAADGNQLFGDLPNFIPDVSIGETDCAQKIFRAEGRNYVVAYIVRGKVATEHRTFDASVEMQREMASLSAQRFRSPRELVAVASKGLYRRMREAFDTGRLPCFPGLEIPFIGYLRDEPFCLNAYFYPTGSHQIIPQPLDGWLFAYSGSEIIGQLMLRSDARIRQSIKLPSECPSLQDAVDATLGYVEACSSPLGLEVDPENCRGLGGHIHVATVTPRIQPSWIARCFGRHGAPSGGFQWIIPPRTFS